MHIFVANNSFQNESNVEAFIILHHGYFSHDCFEMLHFKSSVWYCILKFWWVTKTNCFLAPIPDWFVMGFFQILLFINRKTFLHAQSTSSFIHSSMPSRTFQISPLTTHVLKFQHLESIVVRFILVNRPHHLTEQVERSSSIMATLVLWHADAASHSDHVSLPPRGADKVGTIWYVFVCIYVHKACCTWVLVIWCTTSLQLVTKLLYERWLLSLQYKQRV